MIGKAIPKQNTDPEAHVEYAETLLAYLEHPRETEQLLGVYYLNVCAPSNPSAAETEFVALAAMAPANSKPVRHLMFAWQSDEQPTRKAILDTVETFLRESGLEGCATKVGVHGDTDNIHIHLAVCTTDREELSVTGRVKVRHANFVHEAAAMTCALMCHEYGFQPEPGALYTVVDGKCVRVRDRSADGGGLGGGRSIEVEYRQNIVSATRIAMERLNAILDSASAPRTWSDFEATLSAVGLRYTLAHHGDNAEPGGLVGVLEDDGSWTDVSARRVKLSLAARPGVRNAGLKFLRRILQDVPGGSAAEIAAGRMRDVIASGVRSWPGFLDACEEAGIRYAIRKPRPATGAVEHADVEVQVNVGGGQWVAVKASSVRLGVKCPGLREPLDHAAYKFLRRLLSPISASDIRGYPELPRGQQSRRKRRKPGDARVGGRMRDAYDAYHAARRAHEEVHGSAAALRNETGKKRRELKDGYKAAKRETWRRQKAQEITVGEGTLARSRLERDYAAQLLDIERDYAAVLSQIEPFAKIDDWIPQQAEFADLIRDRTSTVVRPGYARGAGDAQVIALEALAGMAVYSVRIAGWTVAQYESPWTGQVALTDRGREVIFEEPRDPVTVRAGLQLSMQKWPGGFELSGSRAFLAAAAREAVRMGIADKISCSDRIFAITVCSELGAKERERAAHVRRVEAQETARVREYSTAFRALDAALGAGRYILVAERPFKDGDGAHRRLIGPATGIRTTPGGGAGGDLEVTKLDHACRDAGLGVDEQLYLRPRSTNRIHVVVDTDADGLKRMQSAGFQPTAIVTAGRARQVIVTVSNPSPVPAVNERVEAELTQRLHEEYGVGALEELPSLRCPDGKASKVVSAHPGVTCPIAARLAADVLREPDIQELVAPPAKEASDRLEAAWAAHRKDVLQNARAGLDESRIDAMILGRLLTVRPDRTREQLERALMSMSRRARGNADYGRRTLDYVLSVAGKEAAERLSRYHAAWVRVENKIGIRIGGAA